ncbi:MAG: hypothetical protein JWP69_1219 [Flaviaesturariibacter sp.]|nr:hypothetical protein [Flaviaesturariibacter sp.]
MTLLRKLLSDPSFYAVLAINIYLLNEFRQDPAQYDTILWLYWCQSVLIGLFTFLEMMTTPTAVTVDLKLDGKPMGRGCAAWFFLGHYGFFHFVYLIFLGTQNGFGRVDMGFFKIAILCIFFSQVVFFVQHKLQYRREPPKLGALFVQPYIRIVPMHLTILLPAFLGWEPGLVFIVLRTILDVLGYVVTSPHYRKVKPPAMAPQAVV